MDKNEVLRVKEILSGSGCDAADYVGHGPLLPVFSAGFWVRLSPKETDVEILRIGSETDEAGHLGWLDRYAEILSASGRVGRRTLGAGKDCVTYVPTATP